MYVLKTSQILPKTSKTSTHQNNFSISQDDVTIIIPTLNEEEAIPHVLIDLTKQGYSHLLVVDGNSSDKTLDIVKEHGVKHVSQQGKGKTGAVETALKHIETPYFVLIDGDCTYSAEDIENLFPQMENNNHAIGARSSGRENIPTVNQFGNWGINKLFNFFFNTKLTDVCSGLYLLETSFAKGIPFTTEGFDVEVEISAYTASKGKISETKIDYFPRVGYRKLNPFRDGIKIISTITRLAVKYRPVKVLTVAAILLILLIQLSSRFQ
jgi:dolichol-phosphate mannosyltransferase